MRRKRVISLFLGTILLCGIYSPFTASAAEESIDKTQKILRLWYDEEAPYGNENMEFYAGSSKLENDGWMNWSLPIGNGFLGANVFGRTETERVQISEDTIRNPYINDANGAGMVGGLNNFAETYIDFHHTNADVTNYTRDLTLNTALSTVQYNYEDVQYKREYFASYPDKVLVMRFSASENAKVTFKLRPEVPWIQEYPRNNTDYPMAKTGTVTAEGDTITLKGHMEYYNINFEGQYKVIPNGGTMTAANDESGDHGTITVENADSVMILMAVGTNYELNSSVFTTSNREQKLDGTLDPHEKVSAMINAAAAKTYDTLYAAHEADYKKLFERVNFDLGAEVPNVTTDVLLSEYQNGTHNQYLEELYFQYGRYLLIASSREGGLPAHLQGIWNQYNGSPWSVGYWHNINVQMNYWPAFSTNLAETFEAYKDYFEAFLPQAKNNAASYLRSQYRDKYGSISAEDSGWGVGTACDSYTIAGIGGSSTVGNGGFTTKMFWDYYDFTRDKSILENFAYPAIASQTKLNSKSVEDVDGKLLVGHSASPEQYHNGEYYYTKGAAYDQQMVWENHKQTIDGAAVLGTSDAESQIAAEQIDRLDPVQVGYSGQIKEFREENYYGEIGEYKHRHISHLVGLYPGTSINSETPAWLDAAKVTLNERGDNATGWGVAHRLNLWARTKDGERTYKLYQQLLKKNTLQNLWDSHPPFQIDGNFGGTAGVAEMLLQSHEGYLAPLASIPSAWESGSYAGLVARGNFEVAAEWSDGNAEKFEILSGAGGECKVSYEGIASASVTTADGTAVSVTKGKTGDGADLISFDTTQGETYFITGFAAKETVAAPSGLTAELVNGGEAKMEWNSSSDAASYNLYKAVNNDAIYTKIADDITGTSYVYNIPTGDRNQRTTYRVTAVSESGKESDGVLVYINPKELTVTEAVAEFLDATTVQFTVTNAADATSYKLYSCDGENDTQVGESKYPVLVLENYDSSKTYAVSAADAYYESDKVPVTWPEAKDTSNILRGKLPSAVKNAVTGANVSQLGANYSFSNITDGNLSTRHAVGGESNNTHYTIEYDLESTYTLDKLTIYDFEDSGATTSRSDQTTVEVCADGTWTKVIDAQPLNFEQGKYNNSGGTVFTTFDLRETKGNKIRVTFNNTNTKQAATIWEMMLSAKDENEYTENTESNVFLNKTATADKSVNGSYPLSNAFDGNLATRWSVNGNPYSVTIDLGGSKVLKNMKIYEYADGNNKIDNVMTTRSDKTTVELYSGGAWTTKIDQQPLSVSDWSHQSGNEKNCTTFDMGFASAEKVKITFNNTRTAQVPGVWEISCTGALAKGVDKRPLLTAIATLETLAETDLNEISQKALDEVMETALKKLTDTNLTKDSVTSAAAEIERKIAIIESGDADALLEETGMYTGSETLTLGGDYTEGMTMESNVGGVGGKVATDKVYKEYGISRSASAAGNNLGTYYGFAKSTQCAIMEYNFMLGDENSKLWGSAGAWADSNTQTELQYRISKAEGFTITTTNTVIAKDIQPNRWYKVAIVIPYDATGAADTVKFYLNGAETAVKMPKTFFSPRHLRLGVQKDEARVQTVYFDNVILKQGDAATYNKNRDAMNQLTLSENDYGVTMKNDVISMENAITVAQLAELLSNDDYRVYSDSTCSAQLGGTDMLTKNGVLVAYANNLRDYERTYHYYKIQIGLNLAMNTYEVEDGKVSGIKINTPAEAVKRDVSNSNVVVSITRNSEEVTGAVQSDDILTITKDGESVSYTLCVDGYAIDEDFDDYVSGNPPKSFAGVRFTGTAPGGVTLFNQNADGAFRLSASGVTEYMGGDYYLYHESLNITNYGVVEFRIKADETTVDKRIMAKGYRPDLEQVDWDNSGHLTFDKTGHIEINGADIMSYQTDKWYAVKEIYDFPNMRKLLYVDGYLVYCGKTAISTLKQITFGASWISTDFNVCFDDVKVYDAYAPASFEGRGLYFDGTDAHIYAEKPFVGTLIFAGYNKGKYVGMTMQSVSALAGITEVTPLALPQNVTEIKAILLDGMTNLMPLCRASVKTMQ